MTGDNEASTRASQQRGGSVVNQATCNADGGIGGTAPLDLSHSGKEDAPNREAMRNGEPRGKHPQGVPVPPKVRIDEDGGNKAATGSKGEEEHQTPKGAPPAEVRNEGPQRVVTSRRGRPVRGCKPQDRCKQIHSGKCQQQKRPYA